MSADIISRFGKNRSEDVVIALDKWQGRDLVDLRVHCHADSNVIRPTRKGLSLQLHYLDDLIDGLQQARDEAERRGLIGGAT
jgi:hypothetical protein